MRQTLKPFPRVSAAQDPVLSALAGSVAALARRDAVFVYNGGRKIFTTSGRDRAVAAVWSDPALADVSYWRHALREGGGETGRNVVPAPAPLEGWSLLGLPSPLIATPAEDLIEPLLGVLAVAASETDLVPYMSVLQPLLESAAVHVALMRERPGYDDPDADETAEEQDAVITIDLGGVISGWNSGAQLIFGWSADQIVGRPAAVIYTPEDIAAGRPRTEMGRAAEIGHARDERWHQRKDMSRFWAAGAMQRLEDETGTLIGFVKRLRDATHLHVALEEADQSRRLVTDALNTGLMGFFAWDRNARLLSGGPHCARLLGVTAERLRAGLNWQELREQLVDGALPPEELLGEWLASRDKEATGIRQPDGTVRYLLWEGRAEDGSEALTAEEGEVGARLRGLVIDVTPAVNAREALRASEAVTERILADSSDVIALLDLEGRATFVSSGGQRVFDEGRLRALSEQAPDGAVVPDWLAFWRVSGGRVDAEAALAQARSGVPARFQAYSGEGVTNTRYWDVIVTPIADRFGRPDRLLSIAQDVTQVTQATERLDLAREAGVVLGTWRLDLARRTISGDMGMAALLRIDPARLQDGVAMEDLAGRVGPGEVVTALTALHEALESGTTSRWEFRVLLPDGQWRWVEASGRGFQPSGAEAPTWSGILLDIEARKREAEREEALATLGDRLSLLDRAEEMIDLASKVLGDGLQVQRAGFGDVDDVRELVTIHRAWSAGEWVPALHGLFAFRTYGSHIEQLRRGDIVRVTDIARDERTAAGADEAAALGVRSFIDVPIIEEGRLVAVAFVHHAQVRQWRENDLAFVQTVAERTWAAIRRIRAQVALQRINETLEQQIVRRTRERDNIWSLSADLLVVFDVGGIIRRVNPSWQRELGCDEDDIIGTSVFTFIHEDDTARAQAGFDGLVLQAMPVRDLDLRLRHGNTPWRTYNWTAVRQNDEIYATGRDVTDRIELEEKLRQVQKMEAVGQLSGGLAHDFNNLLSGIGGGLELLARRIEQGRTENLSRYIAAAQNAAERAAALTHRLLAFSRRQMLNPQPTDTNALIGGMLDLLRSTLGPAIALELHLREGLRHTLIDANQLENALLNLCLNARDAMPDGGTLTLATSNRDLEAGEAERVGLKPGAYLVLTVTDTGVGIEPAAMSRVFDPFFTTKPLGKGTGLGLSMIYGFVRQSGGRIDITSEPGRGTMVEVLLPKYIKPVAHEASAGAAVVSLARASSLTILVVDDEPTVRMVVQETLMEDGHQVIEASDGPAGLAVLADPERKIDAIISDVGMPGGMNGRQFVDRARLLRPGVPVLFITGYAEQKIFAGDDAEDQTQVLLKPFTTKALRRQLQRLLG